ncbi:MAG: Arginase [Phenylobacterium sp.]|nr:Arginase [Phenylobacterium sp.]
MRSALLHLDSALTDQRELARSVSARGGRGVDLRHLGPALRLWSRPWALQRLRARIASDLPAAQGPTLVFSGSGDFHHITPTLLDRAGEAAGHPPVTLVHFDNHPDWVKFANGAHCGSWVGWAARLPNVARVVTVGVCSDDIRRPEGKGADLDLLREDRVELYAYRAPGQAETVAIAGREWPTIAAMGEAAFVDFLPTRIPTTDVYLTIDKDVLQAQDAGTNWDQGRTSLGFLTAMLKRIAEHHRVIGADVVGDWSPAVYGGGILAGLLKQAEALRDQPWSKPGPASPALNEAANLELLELIGSFER